MDAGAWLKKVIKMRKQLIRMQKGRMDGSMLKDYDFVSRHVEANRYNHGQALNFIYRHSSKIENIIPKGLTHAKITKEFYTLLESGIALRAASSGICSRHGA